MTHVVFTRRLSNWTARFKKRAQRALYIALQALICLSLVASSAAPAVGAPSLSGSETIERIRPSAAQEIQSRISDARTRDKLPLPDVQAGSRVWAGTSNAGVWLYSGGGWEQRSNGLGNVKVHSLATNPANHDVLLAVTPGGVFRTADAGLNWSQVSMPYTQSGWNTVFWDRAGAGQVVISGPDLGEIYHTDPRAAISGDGASFSGIDLPLNPTPEGEPQIAQAIPGDVWGFNGIWYMMGNTIHNVSLGWPCHKKEVWVKVPGEPWTVKCTWPRQYWDVGRYVSGLWGNPSNIFGLFDHPVGNPIIESTDQGDHWTPSTQYLSSYRGIVADPVRGNRLWVLASGYLYYSDSGLNGFVGVSGLSMPSAPRTVAVDGYQGVIYAGSNNRGFAFSETDGSSWTRIDIPFGGPVTSNTHLLSLAAEQPPILDPPDPSTLNDCEAKNGEGDPRECQLSSAGQTQGYAGDPVNTRTGNLSYSLVDLKVQTMSMPLTLQRSYSSQGVAIPDGPLGARWTHNHDSRLVFPDDPGGQSDEVWLKAHSANQYRFYIGDMGDFIPDAGVQAELVEESGPPIQYRLTTASQSEYLFDENGVLLEWTDPQGRIFTYTYDLSGRLERVTAPDVTRYIELTYDIDDRISSIEDHTGRSVNYGYDSNGDLASFTDVMGETWSYTYDGNHQLTHILDPRGVTTLHTEYEASTPEVVDFNAVTVSSYGSGQDNDPTHSIEDGGATLHLGGNAWKKIDFPYTVTSGTRLAFDFKSPAQGEIHAFGVDTDNDWHQRTAFQLYGIHSSDFIQDYDNYAGNEPDWVHYDIPLGAYYTGEIEYLVFVNDHDVTTPTAESYYSNVEIYETYSRVARQYNGENELLVELSYGTDGTTTFTDGLGNTTTHTYNDWGVLVEQVDALGGVQTQNLDPNYRPGSVTDPAGDALLLDWTSDGANLQSIADPEGGQTDFTYDSLNNITEVVDPRGYLTTFTYDDTRMTSSTDSLGNTTTLTYTTMADAPQPEGLLKTITDPLGRVTSFTYDALGQRLTMTDADGETWSYSYDDLGRLQEVTDPLGRVQRSECDAAGNLVLIIQNYDFGFSQNAQNVYNITTELAYDQVGNLVSVTDSLGRVALYVYDDADRVTQQTDPAGNVTTYAYDAAGNLVTITDPLGRVTQFRYDALNRLHEVEDALGGITTRDYNPDGTLASVTDALGRVTTYTYDDAKRLETVLDPLGGTSMLAYDLAGNLITATNPLGNSTAYVYDPLNHLEQVTDALGGVTQYVYDAVGNRVQVQDANGHIIEFDYDVLNRLEESTDPNGNSNFWAYDPLGNLSQTTDGLGNTTTFSYDDLNRLVLSVDALGYTTEFAYDPLGSLTDLTDANGIITHYDTDVLNRLVGVVENVDTMAPPDAQTNVETGYTYDAVGNLLSILDANGHLRTFNYDNLNRRVGETDPLGNTSAFTYDAVGNLAARTDALGFITGYGYDAGDRLTSIDYPAPDADISFTYDLLGNLIGMVDGVGTTTWTHDALSRPLTVNDPFGGEVAYTYDAVGNRLSIEYPSGKQVSYDYDPGYRLVEVEDWDSRVTMYSYDAANRLTTATLPNGVLSGYAYDALGQVTSLEHAFGAQTLASFEYTYDPVGNRVQAIEGVQDPLYEMFLPVVGKDASAASAQAEILDGGLLTATPTPGPTTTSTPTLTSTATATPTPTDISVTQPAPTSTTTSTPTGTATTTATMTSTVTATGTPTITVTASEPVPTDTPEGVSSLVRARGHLAAPLPYRQRVANAKPLASVGWNSCTIDYSYDALYRLTTADYSTGEFFHYAYDAVGNRLTQTTQAGTENYTYDAADRLTSLDGTPISWDDNGNLISDGEWTYAYDHADRLTTLSGASGSFNFAYSGLGDRLQGTDGENPVQFSLDLHAGLTQVLEEGSNAYLYGLYRIGAEAGGAPAYYLGDALGSVRGVSGEDGKMDLARSYTPFGEELHEAGWGESVFGYAGEWEDPAGLLYLRARYYAAAQGRFLSKDPFMGSTSMPASLHAYSYAFNNPLLYTDPSGEFPMIIAAALAGAAIGGGIAYGAQVIQNYRSGLGGADAWFRCVNWGEVGLSALEGGVFGALGFLTGGMISAAGLTGWAAFAVGGAIDVTTGMIWDMVVRGYTPSQAFFSNIVSFGIGAGIGYGLEAAGRGLKGVFGGFGAARSISEGLEAGTRGAPGIGKAGRYGGSQQRQALANLVSDATSLREAKGLVYGFREMRRLGYSLEDISLAYRGRQGVDAVYSKGGQYAILESKAGSWLSSLRTYSGLRQGSMEYNQSRLQRYMRWGDGTNNQLAEVLLDEAGIGQLKSFASFYRSRRLYELPLGWPDVGAIRR
jgi:RHS repeat-associated protein